MPRDSAAPAVGSCLLGLALVLTACGGATGESVAGVDDAAPTSTSVSASDEPQAFCDAIADFERASEQDDVDPAVQQGAFGDPAQVRELIDEIRRTAPPDISEDADLFFSAMLFAADPMGEVPSQIDDVPVLEIQEAGERVYSYSQQRCGATAGG